MMATRETTGGGELPPKASCATCVHALVCRVRAGFANLMADFEAKKLDPPVDPDRLAEVCTSYLPTSPIVVTFRNAEGTTTVPQPEDML